jgi:hypothetical protein
LSNAMTSLATITLGTAQATVTFGSIPQGYRDLRLVIAGANSNASALFIRMNGDTGANYNDVSMYGDGSTTGSSPRSNISSGYIASTDAATSNVATVDIMDYSATDKHKSWLARGNASGSRVESRAGRWANTAAVTSLLVNTDTNTFSIGCVFSLYGILA